MTEQADKNVVQFAEKEDETKYVTIIETVTTKEDKSEEKAIMVVYSKSPDEALVKVVQARGAYNRPDVKLNIVGTYRKVNLVVNAI